MSGAVVRGGLILCVSVVAGLTGPSRGQSGPSAYETYAGHAVVRVLVSNERELATMLELSPDCWSEAIGIGSLDFRIPPASMPRLAASGIPFEVLIPDLGPIVIGERDRLAAGGAADGDWYADYHPLDEYHQRLNDIAAAHPDLVSVVDLGDALEGRPILGLRISGSADEKPAVAINGCQHAREWVSPMVNMFVIDALVDGYGVDPEITALVDDLEFYVIPIVNPDGYSYTWTNQRLWRKNRRDNGGGSFGVDTNRNWGYEWGGGGSSSNPDSETYRGTAPFSEPETQAMRDFYIAHPNIAVGLDFHSFGQLNLYPWGYTTGGPSDGGAHEIIASDMVDAIFAVHGEFYEHGPITETLYQASGNAVDWFWGDQGALAFTIELRDTGAFGFELPPGEIRPTAEENLQAVLVMAQAVAAGVVWGVDPPTLLVADQENDIVVNVVPSASGALDPALGAVYWRADGGAFTPGPMEYQGGTTWIATLPALPCGTAVDYYFEVVSESGIAYTNPGDAPASFHSAETATFDIAFADDFESDLGWTVESVDLLDGAWDRGVPAGAGDRGDPTVDGDGSGACYLTDNTPGNSDVDGGPTYMISPVLDITGQDDPYLTFRAWFYNDDMDMDRLTVDLSDDGGASWTEVLSLGNTDGWSSQQVRVMDHVTPSASFRVRFGAVDQPNDSVTEAGIDGVQIVSISCDGGVPGDVTGDGLVGVEDLLAVLGAWGPCAGCPEDLDGDGAVAVSDLLEVLANWS